MKRRTIFLPIVVVAVIVGLIVVMIIALFPLIRAVMANAGNESDMVSYINTYGAKGVLVLIALQVLQVIVAVIPAMAVQVLTGLCYGAWLGTLINLIGCLLGNIIVIFAMRHMKGLLAPLMKRIRPGRKEKKFLSSNVFSKMKRPEMAVFFCFLIPGIPNGFIPYVFSEAHIPFKRYIIAVAAGCIPSTLICNYLGNSVSQGNYAAAIIVTVAIVAIALLALRFQNKIFK